MCRFIESICCQHGQPELLKLHQQRVNRTFQTQFPHEAPLNLSEIVNKIPEDTKYKCRVEYDASSYEMTCSAYINPVIDSLQIIVANEINYNFKSADRIQLDQLFNQRQMADDIIIIKNEKVTDSYFANLAFYDGTQWWTSDSPLLHGVKREHLLSKGLLKIREIRERDLVQFQKVSLINAMLDLDEVSIILK